MQQTQSDHPPHSAASPSVTSPLMVPMPARLMLAIATRAEESGRLDEAEPLATHLLAALPHEPNVLHLAGVVAFRRNRHLEAVGLMEQAIARAPGNALFLRNISEMYRIVGRLDDALAAARRAVALNPTDATILHNQAVIHQERGEVDPALACARRAISLRPDMAGAHFAAAEALLVRGDYAEGWEEYEWRFRLPGVPPVMPAALQQGTPQWGGGALGDGVLLLIGDQGFGDVIQFSRYIPWVLAKGHTTVLATSLEMAPLMRRLFPGLLIVTNWAECPAVTAYCPLSGLPRLHGTRPDTIPAATPIHAEAARVALWREWLDATVPAGDLRVGVVWAGRPTHRNDRNRSMRLAALAASAAIPGVTLISLQKGEAAAEVGSYDGPGRVIDTAARITDYEDTVAAIAALDLVVTVDTSVAHLAGAMGRPAWVLLPYACDWRWLRGRAESPWYPSLRLFRQVAPARWDAPMAEVVAALGAFSPAR